MPGAWTTGDTWSARSSTDPKGRQWSVALMDVLGQEGDPDDAERIGSSCNTRRAGISRSFTRHRSAAVGARLSVAAGGIDRVRTPAGGRDRRPPRSSTTPVPRGPGRLTVWQDVQGAGLVRPASELPETSVTGGPNRVRPTSEGSFEIQAGLAPVGRVRDWATCPLRTGAWPKVPTIGLASSAKSQ